MHHWKYLKSTDAMERVTRQQLCDNFDEILAKVEKDDVGFVILNPDGTDGQVLCPAHWMDYCFDNDFGCIVTCAIRYSINRRTYMPSLVVDFVRKYMNVLDTNTIKVAIEDIVREIDMGGVDDPNMWLELKKELLIRQAYMLEVDQINTEKNRHHEKSDTNE